ncbi:hypothetical protein NDK43_24530 [Neobacillus pocheonensis]|uniref:Uncharacterized protein n=1 Tax=Neobacillus pocheonensis TaxID=363869 RepID=A0ABT0WF31_9BACI|nr:hypothetical protein [Neobacillus pocheonensis]
MDHTELETLEADMVVVGSIGLASVEKELSDSALYLMEYLMENHHIQYFFS